MKIKLRNRFIGGDTMSFDFNAKYKVAGDANFPVKIYKGFIDPDIPYAPTYEVTNLVQNGGFTSTANWNASGSTFTVSGGVCTITGNNSTLPQVYQPISQTVGHMVYFRVKVKPRNSLITQTILISNTIAICRKTSPTQDVEILLSGIRTITSASETLVIASEYADAASATGKTMEVKEVLAVDLTLKGLTGLSLAECDIMFATWHDGTATRTPYREITDQASIDKFAEQNEIPITSVDTVGRTAVYNGKTYVQQNSTYPALRDDMSSAISTPAMGFSSASASTLLVPSNASWADSTPSQLNKTGQNGSCISVTTSVNGEIPQAKIRINAIKAWEDKYGTIPVDLTGTATEVLARKIAWAKANWDKITRNIYSYGMCPTGNKINLAWWAGVNWGTVQTNISSSPTLLVSTTTDGSYIDSNGFIYFLIYTDPASTTSPTLLVLTGHGLTTNDTIGNLMRTDTLNGITRSAFRLIQSVSANGIAVNTVNEQVAGDTIKKYRYSTTKIAESGTTSTTVKVSNHGLTTGDIVTNTVRSWVVSEITVIDANTFTCNTEIVGQVSGDSLRLSKYIGQQTAESTVLSSTVYLDYASIDIQYKAPVGYEALVPQNPRRDAVIGTNYDDIVLLQRVYQKNTGSFVNKLSGSTVANPHIAKIPYNPRALMLPADDGVEFTDDTAYNGNYTNAQTVTAPMISMSNSPRGILEATVKGRTLKQELKYTPATWAEWGKVNAVGDSTGFEFTQDGGIRTSGILGNQSFKSSTKYGVLLNVVSNTLATIDFYISIYDALIGNSFGTTGSVGNKKYTITTPSSITNNWVYISNNGTGGSGKVKIAGIRIFELPSGSEIESDFTNRTPDELMTKYPFFTGIQSVPANRVISVGKNLFDKSKITTNMYLDSSNGAILPSGVGNNISDYIRVTGNITLSGHTYPMGLGSLAGLVWFDSDKNYISGQAFGNTVSNVSYTKPSNAVYVRYTVNDVDLNTAQLELNSTATVYEPYKETILPIASELKSISTVKDEYNSIDGTTTKNISDWLTLDGSLPWSYNGIDSYNETIGHLVYFPVVNNVAGCMCIKNDGTILPIGTNVANGVATSTIYKVFYLRLSTSDTGFPTTYSPGPSIIKAYFYGWRMCNPDGSSPWDGVQTQSWKKIMGSDATVVSICPTASYAEWTPYKACYPLLAPAYSGVEWTCKTLQASDVVGMSTGYTNIDYAIISKPMDHIGYNNIVRAVDYSIEGYTTTTSSTYDTTSNVGLTLIGGYTNLFIGFTKGTTLAQAQTALAGKKFYYKLAIPSGAYPKLDAYKNGTVYIEAADGSALPVLPELTYRNDVGFIGYPALVTQGDSKIAYNTTKVKGGMAQIRYSMNVVRQLEDYWTTNNIPFPYPSTVDIATKIAWIKANTKPNNVAFKSYENGSGPNGNKAYFTIWDYSKSAWHTFVASNTASVPTLISYPIDSINNYITPEGFIYAIAYSDVSDGVTVGVINVDNVFLDIDFINANNAVLTFNQQSIEVEDLTQGKAPAYLVEVDATTGIVTPIYSGSNPNFRTGVKTIQADIYAMAQGVLNGMMANGLTVKIFATIWNLWMQHTSSSIVKSSNTTTNIYIQSNNKIYILIYSTYPSDGITPSQLALDTFNIHIDLVRAPDVVQGMPVNLPRYWGIVIQGFSPCWDSTDAKVERGILRLKKSNGDRYFLERIAGNMLQIYKNINNTALVSYSDRVTTIFEKNKVVNFFVAQTSSQLIVKYLKNNDLIGTMIQNEATISLGIYDLYMLCIETLGYEADAYFSRTKLIDLEKYNIQDGGAAFDTFAEASLMGTQAGLELPNLIPSFNDSRWTKHANAVVSGDSKTLTLNATAAWQNSYVEIPILPNNRYEVMWEETHSVNSSVLQIDEKYNNITIKSASTQVLNGTSSTFTVGPNTNKIRVYISSNAIGAFSFSNLSLKLKM